MSGSNVVRQDRIKGVNRSVKRLADGTRRVYFYHRASGLPLVGEYGSPEFIASFADAEQRLRAGRIQRHGATLKTVISGFIGSVDFNGLRDSTKTEYRRLLGYAEIEFGDFPLKALEDPRTRGELLAWRDRLAVEGKLREAENRLTVLARVFSWAIDRGFIATNPLLSWGRSYKADRADKIWTPEHVEAFVAVASSEMALALYVALYTGQRQGDLLRLMWTNYADGVLRLKQSKGSRHVVVPCIADLKAMLDQLRDGDRRSTHILTTANGQPWKKRAFSGAFKETCDRAGITGLTFHDLRGTAVTMLADAGCSEAEIVSITGHTLASAHDILERYMSRTATQSRAAMAKLENHLRTVSANRVANQITDSLKTRDASA